MLRRSLLGLGWLAAALVIALGSAGIVAGLDQLPTTGARPELTYGADRQIEPALDAATSDLQALSDQVDALAGRGRDALTALISGDTPGLQAAIAAGKIAGTVEKGDFGDVIITADAAALDAFFATPESATLFKLFVVLHKAE